MWTARELLGYRSVVSQEKEIANGGVSPRMLCLDDYFMVETEKVEKDRETGKQLTKTVRRLCSASVVDRI